MSNIAKVRVPNNSEQAVIYLTECTLATVELMAMKKSTTKGEFIRQIMIAQTGVSFILCYGIDAPHRIADVISNHNGEVAKWARSLGLLDLETLKL